MSTITSLVNADSGPFWQGASQERLMLQKCGNCRAVQFPPAHHCARCWGIDREWVESSGVGKVESYTVVRRAPTTAFRDRTPYVVASVVLEDGPRMITNLVGERALDVGIGDDVHVVFVADSSGNFLPQFEIGKATT